MKKKWKERIRDLEDGLAMQQDMEALRIHLMNNKIEKLWEEIRRINTKLGKAGYLQED